MSYLGVAAMYAYIKIFMTVRDHGLMLVLSFSFLFNAHMFGDMSVYMNIRLNKG